MADDRKWFSAVLLTLAPCVGCSAPPRTESEVSRVEPPPTSSIRSIAIDPSIPRDQLLMELVLADFVQRQGRTPADADAGTLILVDHQNNGPPFGMVSDDQLSSELRDRDWPALAHLAADLRSRNGGVQSMPAPRSSVVPCVIADFSTFSKGLELSADPLSEYWRRMRAAYPDAACWVEFWLPGYAPEGDRALVRFSFGPSAHGATATYLVMMAGDSWVIEWCELAYYV
jgi:hypothetical protein